MPRYTVCAISLLFLGGMYAGAYSQDRRFAGAWCAAEDDLVITFLGADSLSVVSTSEKRIAGRGTYRIEDSLFIAEVVNKDLSLSLTYQYRWINDTAVEALPKLLVVNGDTAGHPQEWTTMRRCAASPSAKASAKNAHAAAAHHRRRQAARQ
jgi:hypothetical protein